MKKLFILLFVFSIGITNQSYSINNNKNTRLYEGFKNPGNAARPRVWWHWMNGNITKDGIRKDLLWMKRVGIGGFQNFDAGLTTPQIVDKRLAYMTPEWKDAFCFATQLADSLGLEMAIAASPGWSQSGGPWVPAFDGMKKLVWREILIDSSHKFNGKLPEPYKTTGNFQNIPVIEEVTAFSPASAPAPEYYKDVAVLAYKVPDSYITFRNLKPKITTSGGFFTLDQLTDNDLDKTSFLESAPGLDYSWIQFEFEKPTTIKALSVVGGGVRDQWGITPPALTRSLEISNDGISFKKVCDIPLGGVPQQTISIPESTSKYFRIKFNNPIPNPLASLLNEAQATTVTPKGIDIAEIILYPYTRINHVEEKAGFASTYDVEQFETPTTNDIISLNQVINLTDMVDAEGKLNWTPPTGQWKIIRYGYSLTGKKNHPASYEATGLEVDKLDEKAVRNYFENYLNQYKDATKGLMGNKGLQYIITDSYEAGQMTWTPLMALEFKKRRGYDLFPWMPVFTGQVIESTEKSEQFLWDWRKTISELFTEYHYDQLTEILRKKGMKRYSESHENGRLFIGDGMDVKRSAAVPMSAMWVPSGWGSTIAMAKADLRESASVAHIYGQNLVAAESLTAFGLKNNAWSYVPENLKTVADLEMANGLNRFIIHTSVHQPVDNKIPGLGLFAFGQWFNRHDTWAEQANAWTDYLARSSYMLQQGKSVADIVYYYGEDNNITGLFGENLPEIPSGYNFDFINADALINLLSIKNGKLVTPSGMSYSVLVLDKNVRVMSLPVLRKIAQLVNQGAIICGSKPEMKADLQGDQEEFNRLVEEVWNTGKANVHNGSTAGQVLKSLNIEPDFEFTKLQDDTELLYVHRKFENSDIYWVNNRKNRFENVAVTFRVADKKPQIWHPETGEKEEVTYRIADGKTIVNLNLTPNDAVFVIFEDTAIKKNVVLPAITEKTILNIIGSWNVSFQPNRGAPANVVFDKLVSFTSFDEPGIKYFSGSATYTKTVKIPKNDIKAGTKVFLDLGGVKNLAEVTVNGKKVGVVWKVPYTIDVTDAITSGQNKLEIKIVNTWVNRLIGDQQIDTKEKITYTTMQFYKPNSPLQQAGLLGPVKIISTNVSHK